MPPTASKALRRQNILRLIRSYSIRSQAELQELLQEDGVAVNQATLSRDLRDLGVVKGPLGYALPNGQPATPPATGVTQAVRQWMLQAIPAQNQVLLKTPIGGANPLALAIDSAESEKVLGTIAGDDTVLVICANTKEAKALALQFQEML